MFNYSKLSKRSWDSEILGLIAAIYKQAEKQELYLKQRPKELERLGEIAKIQSTEASNAIEGIVTSNTRIRQLVEEKLPAIEIVRKAMMSKIGRFIKQDIRDLCPALSLSSVEGSLRKMVAAEELKREGAGKATVYYRLK